VNLLCTQGIFNRLQVSQGDYKNLISNDEIIIKTTDRTYIIDVLPPMGQTKDVVAALCISETVYNSKRKSGEKG
jgi:hypothetical protein